MSIQNATHYWAIENPPESFSGDFTIQIERRNSNVGSDALLDVPLINGKLDRQAVIDFVGNGRANIKKLYALKGSIDAIVDISTDLNGFIIYNDGFIEDENGNIIAAYDGDSAVRITIESQTFTGQFSTLHRIRVPASVSSGSVMGLNNGNNPNFMRWSEGSLSTSYVSSDFGDPDFYKNGALEAVTNMGEMHQFIADGQMNNIITVDGIIPAHSDFGDGTPLNLLGSRDSFYGDFQAIALWDDDQTANVETINNEVNALYSEVINPGGNITVEGVEAPGTIVDIYSMTHIRDTDSQFVQTVIADENGDWAMTEERDPTLGYRGQVFREPEIETGTITGTTSNTFTDTSKDIPTNDHFQRLVRTSGGTQGAGQERTIQANEGDTWTLSLEWATEPDGDYLILNQDKAGFTHYFPPTELLA
jgi:hypothetical protein